MLQLTTNPPALNSYLPGPINPSLIHYSGAEELKKYKKGLFILTDSEHKLLYQYYNTSLVESGTAINPCVDFPLLFLS